MGAVGAIHNPGRNGHSQAPPKKRRRQLIQWWDLRIMLLRLQQRCDNRVEVWPVMVKVL
jgi:hypothetical protein